MICEWAVAALAALLDREPPAAVLPPMWQLGQLLQHPAQADLGPDGHPRTGIPSPPGPGLRRMFAGGRVTCTGPVRIGVPATRRTRLVSRTDKQGRTGPLTFLTVAYEFEQDSATVLVEEQDLVYRGPSGPRAGDGPTVGDGPAVGDGPTGGRPGGDQPLGPGRVEGGDPVPTGPGERIVRVDPTLLFRFSALTYNAHRIHYDRDFAATEGYPGLLVHGSLQALLMAEHCAEDCRLDASAGYRFDYRLTAPLFDFQGLIVGGDPTALYVRDRTGRHTAAATLVPAA